MAGMVLMPAVLVAVLSCPGDCFGVRVKGAYLVLPAVPFRGGAPFVGIATAVAGRARHT